MNSYFHFHITVESAASQVLLQQPKVHSSLFCLSSGIMRALVSLPVKSPIFFP